MGGDVAGPQKGGTVMKAGYGCKLFGAQQVFTGVQDAVTLLHSVVGCNFGSMGYHFTACDMSDVRQTCTVLSDSDIVFSGEESFRLALEKIRELYRPKQIFVAQGCVSDIIQDDLQMTAADFTDETGIPVLVLETAGYRGNFLDGYEAAAGALLSLMSEEKRTDGECPKINLLGLGTDDFRLEADIKAIRELLGDKAKIGCVLGKCSLEELKNAGTADLNICFGRGVKLAEAMERKFHIPYAEVPYPYGLTGAKALWGVLREQFGLDYSKEEAEFRRFTGEKLKRVYSYLESLYGVPVSILGTGARAKGLAAFLDGELGFRVETAAVRENFRELEDFYDEIRKNESAILFASSFEQEIGDELEIPVVRFDYPVFDRITLSDRPYVGAIGTLCLVEDILNEIIHGRTMKGALYQ